MLTPLSNPIFFLTFLVVFCDERHRMTSLFDLVWCIFESLQVQDSSVISKYFYYVYNKSRLISRSLVSLPLCGLTRWPYFILMVHELIIMPKYHRLTTTTDSTTKESPENLIPPFETNRWVALHQILSINFSSCMKKNLNLQKMLHFAINHHARFLICHLWT